MEIYKLYCDEFSGWYLEMIKPGYQQPIDKATYEATLAFFDRLLRVLHPFMPFITEELWQNLYDRQPGESIMTANQTNMEKPIDFWLRKGKVDGESEPTENESRENRNGAILKDTAYLKQVITEIRAVRAAKNIPQKEQLTLISPVELNAIVSKLANVQICPTSQTTSTGQTSKFIVGTTEFAIPMDQFINVEEELRKLEADLQHQQGFLRGVMAKLSNERFVQNAQPEIVALEQKKKADAEARIAALEEAIKALKK